MSREKWENTIRWMQKEHELWDLGPSEELILDYLAKNNGAVKRKGKRRPLNLINNTKIKNS